MTQTLSKGRSALEERYDWVYFVSRSGASGRSWAEAYRDGPSLEVRRSIAQALALLRRRQIPEGRALLSQVEDILRSASGAPGSLGRVLERWYFAALAYHHYCIEAYEDAEQCLDEAHRAVCNVLDQQPFLLPFVEHCSDFRTQRIRIARERRRWEEMRAHIDHVRGMIGGSLPLCVLPDGTPLGLSTLRSYYEALPSPNEEERRVIEALLDPERNLRAFDVFVQSIYAAPGIVIPYP